MAVLHIEHGVSDFDGWKAMFDSDPADRRGSGVTAYRIMRSAAGDHVAIDLEFGSEGEAEAMLAKLRPLWAGPAAGMIQAPDARVFAVVEQSSL